MATTGVYNRRTFIAGEDLSSAKWHFVTLEADGKVDIADADAEECIGVAMTNPDAEDKAVTVATDGEVKVYVGTGGLTPGDDVVTDANGEAVERSTSASASAVTMGKALEAASAGDVAKILLYQAGKVTNEA